MMAVIKLHGF